MVSELLGVEVLYKSVAPPTPEWVNDPSIPDLFKQMLLQVPGVERTNLPSYFRYKNPNLEAKLFLIYGTTSNVIRVSVSTGDISHYKFEPEIRTLLTNSLRPALGDQTEETVQAMQDERHGDGSFACRAIFR